MTSTPIRPSRRGALLRTRRHILKQATALSGLAVLAACSLPGQGAPPRQFRLTPKSTFDAAMPSVDWSLAVLRPNADRSVDTVRIPLVSGGLETQYYANAEWSQRAPLMVQTLMVESFANSGSIAVVGNDRMDVRPDFRLNSVIREFQAEGEPGAAPTVRVAIEASLVKMPQRDVVGTFTFERSVAAGSDRIEDIVTAYDEALGSALKRLVPWALETGNGTGDRASL